MTNYRIIITALRSTLTPGDADAALSAIADELDQAGAIDDFDALLTAIDEAGMTALAASLNEQFA